VDVENSAGAAIAVAEGMYRLKLKMTNGHFEQCVYWIFFPIPLSKPLINLNFKR